MPHTSDSRRAVASTGVSPDDRQAGALARDAQGRRAGRRVADDGCELHRIGDGVRGRGDGVGAGRLRHRRVACTMAS